MQGRLGDRQFQLPDNGSRFPLWHSILTPVTVLQLCELGLVPVLEFAVVANDARDVSHNLRITPTEKKSQPRVPCVVGYLGDWYLCLSDVAADVGTIYTVVVCPRAKPFESCVCDDVPVEFPPVQCDLPFRVLFAERGQSTPIGMRCQGTKKVYCCGSDLMSKSIA